MKNLTLLLVCVLLVGSALAADGAKLDVGTKAPTFFLRDIEGNNFFLSRSIKAEKPILISFFANWCIPCRTEIPLYEKMLADKAFSDVEVIYVHVSEPRKSPEKASLSDIDLINEVVNELGMTHKVLYDRYGVGSEKYFATSLPTTVIIDRKGKIAYYHTGFQLGDEKTVAKILTDLVNE